MEIETIKKDVGMNWKSVDLVTVCDFQGGTQPPKSEWSSKKLNGFVRMIQIRDFTQGKDSFIEYVKDNNKLKKCTKDDIMIGRYGASIGKILTGIEGAYNVALVKTIPSSELDKRYFFHYLNTPYFQNFIQNAGSRAAQAGFNKEELKDLQIPLPPLATQKRIAEILDAADALRRKDQELLKKYDELAQAIFMDMFGDPVKNEKGWDVKKLKEICLKITDGTHFSPPNLSIGIPYITAKHLKQDGVDFYSNPTYISQKDHEEIFSRCTPEKGDVLYIKDGATTGIAAVNEYDFEFSMLSSLALIKPQKDKINSYYLSCYLNNKIVKQELIRSYMAGAAIKRFTLEKLNKFEIVVPHIDLQNSFASKWIKLQESITSVKKSKATILFDSLIQKAFKGELVV
jgi:type I restriction enzyme S subunit